MLKITNPATATVIQTLPEDTEDSIHQKFKAAAQAQPLWARTPLAERLKIIQNFRTALIQNTDRLATLLTSEMGKPISQAKNEITGVIPRLDFFLEKTTQVLTEQQVSATHATVLEKITYEPLGVIANISAWNYPYFVGTNVLIPALLTGNAVLYKPSEFSTLSGLAIEQLLHQAGVPQAVMSCIVGSGPVGAHLVQLPIHGLFFTGSYSTGCKIAQVIAQKMIKTQFELGGKDPVYVCEDAPIDIAVASTADGAFYNTGQGCCSIERLYVHEQIYTPFIEAFLKTVQNFAVGDPTDSKTYLGPLTRPAQLEYLEYQVQDALKQGAKLLCGGKKMARPGYYFEPTVLVDVNSSMSVMRDESFGPIIGIQKVKNDAEAIHAMNDTPYGLTAGIYTPNLNRAQVVLSQMHTGTVYLNCCDRVSAALPWSGRNHSGIGSTLSTHGIQTFVQPKAWHLKK